MYVYLYALYACIYIYIYNKFKKLLEIAFENSLFIIHLACSLLELHLTFSIVVIVPTKNDMIYTIFRMFYKLTFLPWFWSVPSLWICLQRSSSCPVHIKIDAFSVHIMLTKNINMHSACDPQKPFNPKLTYNRLSRQVQRKKEINFHDYNIVSNGDKKTLTYYQLYKLKSCILSYNFM
jgi:hypothetical protein